jgi:hypothetical protein
MLTHINSYLKKMKFLLWNPTTNNSSRVAANILNARDFNIDITVGDNYFKARI